MFTHALTSFGITVEQQLDVVNPVMRSSTVQQTGRAEPMNANLPVQSSKLVLTVFQALSSCLKQRIRRSQHK